ncbi:ABC transporter ATP-binding protein [Bradyrhizobium sp. RT10b]|uniref:ABC transporter ATP-binding protein n=1 Tax=Bradyrhizobium sp. RT10b TaxID=3156331 RepID=UPI0033951337
MTAIETRDLSIRFGHFAAVSGVSLAIAAGSRHALIGPNGAGKTTLVHALTGGVAASSGMILISGDDVTRLGESARVRRGLSRTYQINQLFRGLSVLDNVVLAVLERKQLTRVFWRRAAHDNATIEEAREHLAFVNLIAHADRPVHELPYGLQRLLEIAVALAAGPRILVLDEPAAGVPAAQSEAIFERIHALPRDLTLLFVEHDMNLVFRFADRITVLVEGRIITEGTPAEISGNERVREVYLGRRGAHVPA